MNAKILAKQKRLATVTNQYVTVVRSVQKSCKHKQLAECDHQSFHQSFEFGDSLPPIRICLDCGLTEQGWGCGYKVLVAPDERIGHIEREKIYGLRVGVFITNEKKGQLLRREITIDALIDKAVKL